MSTPAAPALLDVPRLPWRGLAWLTLAVLAAHLALLGIAPMVAGPKPSPLASKFITRTIVIAPPAAVQPSPAPPPSSPPAVAKPPAAKPPSPRPAVRPQPASPAETVREAAPPPEVPGPDLTAQAAVDTAVPPEEGQAASPPAPAASAAAGAGATSADSVSGQVAGAVPLRVPGSVRLAFAVTGQQGTSPMQGVFGELVWLQDGQQYDARLSLTFLFRTIRTQHSTGAIGATGIEPARFSETRRNEVASHFVRDQSKVIFSNNAPSVPLLPGAQDRLSVVMQLGALMAGDPGRYPPGAVIAVQTVGPRDGDIWTFSIEGEEKLSLPAGEVSARKLTRGARKPFDDKVELWVAPELGYLPVRIKQTQTNGDFADLQLRELPPARP